MTSVAVTVSLEDLKAGKSAERYPIVKQRR